jgi:hypothetical protein
MTAPAIFWVSRLHICLKPKFCPRCLVRDARPVKRHYVKGPPMRYPFRWLRGRIAIPRVSLRDLTAQKAIQHEIKALNNELRRG